MWVKYIDAKFRVFYFKIWGISAILWCSSVTVFFVLDFSFDTLTEGENRIFDRLVWFTCICGFSIAGYFALKVKEKIPVDVQEWMKKKGLK